MNSDERTRILDLFNIFRRCTSEEGLLRLGAQDGLALATQQSLPYSAVLGLQQYARCRGWALHYRRTGKPAQARREQALAGLQTRYFRSL